MEECSFDLQEFSEDETKAQRIKYALEFLLKQDEQHLTRIFKDLKEIPYPKHNSKSKGKGACENSSDSEKINTVLLPTIAVFLKFYELLGDDIENIKKGLLPVEKRRHIYKEIIKFVDLEMRMVPYYEIGCITEILFNNDENRDGILELLKLKGKASKGKQIREKVWNAGWDTFFIKILNFSNSRYIQGETVNNWKVHNPILITKDKDLYKVGNEMIHGGTAGIKYSDEDHEFIEDMMWGLQEVNKEAREKFMKEANFMEHFKNIVKKLEMKLNL